MLSLSLSDPLLKPSLETESDSESDSESLSLSLAPSLPIEESLIFEDCKLAIADSGRLTSSRSSNSCSSFSACSMIPSQSSFFKNSSIVSIDLLSSRLVFADLSIDLASSWFIDARFSAAFKYSNLASFCLSSLSFAAAAALITALLSVLAVLLEFVMSELFLVLSFILLIAVSSYVASSDIVKSRVPSSLDSLSLISIGAGF
mmetsp:Transcript_29723/g.42181  ORF Transcript_29723/g.42181 Transcript_29723/m.42181 type:complete len:203 (-) Transcript_29723:470-1078(-)